jgi:arylsulfatase A-like enzyme
MKAECSNSEGGQSHWRAWWSGQAAAAKPLVGRGLVLLLVLCGIKATLLAHLVGHLYQEHWRLDLKPVAWVDYANFYLLVLLVGLTFFLAARRIASLDKRAIRGFNLACLGAGLLFAFFSLCRMKNTYLYPVMTGTLDLADLWPYLRLDLLFEPPFLGAYVLVLAFGYWLLARSGRERWTIWGVGGAGVLYLVLNLQELVTYGNSLMVINCFGLAGLASWRLSRGALAWRWQLAPLVLGVAGWVLLGWSDRTLFKLDAYFVLVLSVAISLWALANLFGRRQAGFYAVASHFLPFYLVAFFFISNRHYPLSDNFTHLIVYGLSLGHYFWEELVAAAAMVLFCAQWHRLFPRLARGLFDGLGLALVLLSLVDLKVTQNMGFRLDWHVLTFNTDPVLLWRTIRPFVGRLFLAGTVLIGAYAALLLAVTRLGRWQQARRAAAGAGPAPFPALVVLLLTLTALWIFKGDKAEGIGLARVAVTSPLVSGWETTKFSADEYERLARSLGLAPVPPGAPGRPDGQRPARDLNVLLIVMESSYSRYLSLFGAADETQPLLKRYRDRMEVFPNFYSNFAGSLNARFAIFNGLYPLNKTCLSYLSPRIPAPSLFEVLHERGYDVSLFYSSHRDYERFNDYVGWRKLDAFYDADNMPGAEKFRKVSWGVEERAVLEAMKGRLARCAESGRRFFLTYVPAAPHMPYDCPSTEFEKFANGAGSLDNDYTGRYKNQLLYMDWIYSSLLQELERLHLLENTLVVITDDHGEMVGEDEGKLGHGWNLEPRLANVPLIIMDPARRGYRENDVLGSQVDILPTVLDLLQVPPPAGELYQGVSLYDAEQNRQKVVYVCSYMHRAIVRGSRYIQEQRSNGARGQHFPVQVFDISHQGLKTVFQPVEESAAVGAELDQFDRFQRSFLVHYMYYRELAARHSGVPEHLHAAAPASRPAP